jgi:hypothetical protein
MLNYAFFAKKHLIVMKIFFSISLFLICISTKSQYNREKVFNLNAFLFCDTKDANIGASCRKDNELMIRNLKLIAEGANLNLILNNYIDRDFNLTNITSSIDSIKFSVADVYFFYFSCHGFRNKNEADSFPNIQVITNGRFMSANIMSLHKKIKSKLSERGNFLITVIDACNTFIYDSSNQTIDLDSSLLTYYKTQRKKTTNKISKSISTTLDPNKAPNIFKKEEILNYEKLFRRTSGDLIITSSKPGQKSFALKDGSRFTLSFIKHLHKAIGNQLNCNWSTILDSTRYDIIKNHMPDWETRVQSNYVYSIKDISKADNIENEHFKLTVNQSKEVQNRTTCKIKFEMGNIRMDKTEFEEFNKKNIDTVKYELYEADTLRPTKTVFSTNMKTNYEVVITNPKYARIRSIIKFKTGKEIILNIMQ